MDKKRAAVKAAQFVLIAVGIVCLARAAVWAERMFDPLPANDFYVYYVGARLDEHRDVQNIYGEAERNRLAEEHVARAFSSTSWRYRQQAAANRMLDTAHSPFLFTAMSWIPRDFDAALQWHRRLLVLAFALAIVILGSVVRLPWAVSLLLAAAAIRYLLPFHHDLIVGNVTSFQMLMLSLALWLDARTPAAGGAMLALALLFKPIVLYVVLLLLISRLASRDYARLRRELAGGAAATAVAFAAAAWKFGTPRIWLDWLPAASETYSRLPGRESNNVSPALPLYQAWGTKTSLVVAASLVVILAVVLFRRRTRDDATVAGAGVLVYLIAAPMVWIYYLAMAVVPAMALLPRRWSAAIGIGALAAISGQHMILIGEMRPLDQYVVTPSLLMLFAAAAWCAGRHDLLRRERRY